MVLPTTLLFLQPGMPRGAECPRGAPAAAARGSERRGAGNRDPMRNRPCATASVSTRFVAAMRRTSTRLVRVEPSRSTSPVCSTRSSFTWISSGSSPTSSRKSVPRSASSNRPIRARCRAREGASLVSEQLAFDERRRQRAAVDRDERPAAAATSAVDRACDQLLARAGFAGHQHRRVGPSHLGDLIVQPQHGRACVPPCRRSRAGARAPHGNGSARSPGVPFSSSISRCARPRAVFDAGPLGRVGEPVRIRSPATIGRRSGEPADRMSGRSN